MKKKLMILFLLVAIVTPPAVFANGNSDADGNLILLTDEQMSGMIGGDLCGGIGTVLEDICETLSDTTKWLWDSGVGTIEFVSQFVKFKPKGLDEFTLVEFPGGSLILDIEAVWEFIFGKAEESSSSTECPATATENHSVNKYDQE